LIRLPDDYGSSANKRYPVIFKLDGERGNFIQSLSATYYLFDMTQEIPDHIIIGIQNTNRNRDMDPEQGAGNFIQFLKTELIPFIDTNYRTDGFRILSGQSFSSVFALYSFLEQPDLFEAYILSSFGLYKESLAVLFDHDLIKCQGIKNAKKKYLFVTNGKMDAYDPDGSVTARGTRFLEILRQALPDSLVMKYKSYDDEGHVPFPSLYDGLRWIYHERKVRNE
jgi:predicted alpha/beta superfamily hydrolase